MFIRLTTLGTALLSATLASPSFSQTQLTFQDCHDAVAAVSRYVTAATDQADEQRLQHTITDAEHAHRVHALTDFRDTHTLDRCMAGEMNPVYQCILTQPGALDLCRQ